MRSLIPATHNFRFTSSGSRTFKATRKAALLLFTVSILLAGGAVAVQGQSALDGFDPNANGAINVVVVQSDGKILIGGGFTSLAPNGGAPVTRNRIARLNPDGTLDPVFNPNANSTVESIAVQADGKILVGGFFNGANSIGGQSRNRIARLDGTTGAADSFDPNANADVISIAVQADGRILAGGNFNGANSIGGATRNFIARLDPTTGAADSFNPNANGGVAVIAVQADGKILAGGGFNGANSIGGATRNFIARLDPSTGLADSFNPNANNVVRCLAVQPDGRILAGGNLTTIGGVTRNFIARLDPTTGAADSFNPNANNVVWSIAVQADGKILAGGQFNGANSIGGATRSRIARLDPATASADSFDPSASNTVFGIAVQADGKILAGGVFATLAPNGGAMVGRNNIARLESDGRLDRTLNLTVVGVEVYTTAVQPDGKILIGGIFSTVLGVMRNNIARLNTDGTLDMAFNPNANNDVYSIAVQTDGQILVGGFFTSIGGQMRNYIARLDGTTGAADPFDPNANSTVFSITVQPDGRILVGGAFSGANSIGGQARNRIARLDPATGLADSFDPNASNAVFSSAVQADGQILAGGFFSTIGGQTRNYIARLDGTTGAADSFNPNANNVVHSLAVQPDGRILVGGAFNGANSIGGQARNRIARLDPATGLADSFNPNANNVVRSIAVQADGRILAGGEFNGANSIGGQARNYIARLDGTTGLADSFNPNANNIVDAIAVQADGKILAGGGFNGANSIGGQTRDRFARLSNETAALQDLSATQAAITWTRGGSSPQFTRVTFEYSANNVIYTFLGSGTASGSNWILTGFNLPTGENFYIRARGYYRTGFHNGSVSITESVRNVFIAGPTPTPTPTPPSTPTPTPPTVSIAGTVLYCSNPVPGPVPNVTLTLTGSASGSTLSNGAGNYTFSSLPSGGNYTVTPSKAARLPGSANINTIDVIATQRHFLNLGTPLTGCRLMAADVNGDLSVNTIDVVAIQRFFLGLSTGIANVGKYKFSPVNRTYTGITSNQAGQNYDTLVFGDVASTFVELVDGQ